MQKSPAFQFYPKDYLSDMKVKMLSWASRGLYFELLCYCWLEGSIPSNSQSIATLCGCHDEAIVLPCLALFQKHPSDDSKLVHKRLNDERIKQSENAKKQSANGLRGAKKRWGGHDSANGVAINSPMAKNSSASASASPSPDIYKEVGFPMELQTEEFTQAWKRWTSHRSEIKKKLTPTCRDQQLKILAKMGEAKAIETIDFTIGKGWQGLVEPQASFIAAKKTMTKDEYEKLKYKIIDAPGAYTYDADGGRVYTKETEAKLKTHREAYRGQ